MRLTSIHLEHFRNYHDARFSFGPHCNVVVGRNASGKSSVIEAIRLLSTTRSTHARLESQLIQEGVDHTRITATFESQKEGVRPQELTCVLDTTTGRTRKTWKLAGVKKSPRSIVGLIPTILFTPDQVELLQRSSAARRELLDQLLITRNPELYECLQRLHYTLQQRQVLLERAREGQDIDISIYTEQLVRDSTIVSHARLELLRDLQEITQRSFTTLSSGASDLAMSLVNPVTTLLGDQEKLREAYTRDAQEEQSHEIAAARNLVGAHRDDLQLLSSGRLLREFGSRGEWRSAIISLMLSALMYLEKKIGEKPILLLDDVFSELDPQHRAHLTPYLSEQQTILTCVDKAELPQELRVTGHTVEIASGTVLPHQSSHASAQV